MGKVFLTNLLLLLFVILSFVVNNYSAQLFFIGAFGLSGAITNQLAIHMLFERVPFLYGSGVIPARFESFKQAIKNLIMEQFFTKEQLDNFFKNEEKKIDLVPIIQEADFTPAFDALSKTVMESPFGSMLGMFGGESALEGLKEPFVNKLKEAIISVVSSNAFDAILQNHLQNSSLSDDIISSIDNIIDRRLNELTPQMVKEIIEKLIKEHLDWLVVWGGVFGGLIGLVSSFFV